jgi:hypothetical protein
MAGKLHAVAELRVSEKGAYPIEKPEPGTKPHTLIWRRRK